MNNIDIAKAILRAYHKSECKHLHVAVQREFGALEESELGKLLHLAAHWSNDMHDWAVEVLLNHNKLNVVSEYDIFSSYKEKSKPVKGCVVINLLTEEQTSIVLWDKSDYTNRVTTTDGREIRLSDGFAVGRKKKKG